MDNYADVLRKCADRLDRDFDGQSVSVGLIVFEVAKVLLRPLGIPKDRCPTSSSPQREQGEHEMRLKKTAKQGQQ